MANTADTANLLIASALLGGAAIGIVKSINGQQVQEYVAVRSQGKRGPSKRGNHRRDSRVELSVLAGNVTPAAWATAKGSLVITIKQMDGTTLTTLTWTNMKVGTYGYSMNDEAPPAEMSVELLAEDDLDTDNFSMA